ncbi:hypothetical protein D3C87_1130680 [compost metagenome]
MALATISTSCKLPSLAASSSMRPMRGSTGNRANWRPSGVSSLLRSTAESSCSRLYPSLMALPSGGSMNGNALTSPRRRCSICKMTAARLVRRISGSVNSGRPRKSSSLYRRTQMPGSTRPHRPLRWLALAWEMASMGRRWTLAR